LDGCLEVLMSQTTGAPDSLREIVNVVLKITASIEGQHDVKDLDIRRSLLATVSRSLTNSDLVRRHFGRIAPLRLSVELARVDSVFYQAVRGYEKGKWAAAKSQLQGEVSNLSVLVELSEKLEQSTSPWATEAKLRELGLEPGRARLTLRDFETYLVLCEATMLMEFGDRHFKEAGEGDAEDLFPRAQLAQDDYRAAHVLAKDNDVELEGAILSRLARHHAKVTNMPSTAHALYMHAVELAASLAPMLPKGGWYIECVEAITAYRKAREEQDASNWYEQRRPILETLEEDLKKIESMKDADHKTFVEYIVKEFAPKTTGPDTIAEMVDLTSDKLTKKEMLKVIARYHTDKNTAWGDRWKVLSEEICKTLTARYENMKGLPT